MKILNRGIDVSHHNGIVDWKRVKESGVEFAMIRAGFGWDNDSQIDRQLTANVSGCRTNGIPFGFYHYSYAMSPEDARKEAAWFLRVIRDYKPEYPVAFDFEESKQLALPPAQQIEIIQTFMDTVEKSGYYVTLYMSASSITHLYHHAPETMSLYDAWVSRWDADSAGYPGPYGMWQYDVTDVGAVPGVTGKCDVNYAYKDYPGIIRSKGLNGWEQVAQKPSDDTLSAEMVPKAQYDALATKVVELAGQIELLVKKLSGCNTWVFPHEKQGQKNSRMPEHPGNGE